MPYAIPRIRGGHGDRSSRQSGRAFPCPYPRLHSVAPRYTFSWVIRQFKHKGLQRLFETGSKRGVQASHVPKLRRQLARLDAASGPQDMNVPGWKLHALEGDLSGHWSVWVSGNWRLTFTFDGEDAVLVDYRDYH